MDTDTPEPRPRDAERSRVAILAAARDEFAEYGLGGARVDRIAERADVNKRLLYYYFDNKETLFRAVLEDTYQQIRTAEQRLLPALLRAAALRFWLSRLGDWHLPREAALLEPKPPIHFERVLRSRIATPWHPAP